MCTKKIGLQGKDIFVLIFICFPWIQELYQDSIFLFVETHTVFTTFPDAANKTVNVTQDKGIQQANELFYSTKHAYADFDYRF